MFNDFAQPHSLKDVSLDTGFYIVDQHQRAEIRLRQKNKQLLYWQETGEGKFNFLQVFIPPARNSIALEPMTCNIDAFNNKDGLQILRPGQGIMGRCGVLMENPV